jgi:hypothetical protein
LGTKRKPLSESADMHLLRLEDLTSPNAAATTTVRGFNSSTELPEKSAERGKEVVP